jgi:hypothetical protein
LHLWRAGLDFPELNRVVASSAEQWKPTAIRNNFYTGVSSWAKGFRRRDAMLSNEIHDDIVAHKIERMERAGERPKRLLSYIN